MVRDELASLWLWASRFKTHTHTLIHTHAHTKTDIIVSLSMFIVFSFSLATREMSLVCLLLGPGTLWPPLLWPWLPVATRALCISDGGAKASGL